MRNFFVVLACMTSILLIVACAKSPVDKAMEKIDKSIEKVEKNKDLSLIHISEPTRPY